MTINSYNSSSIIFSLNFSIICALTKFCIFIFISRQISYYQEFPLKHQVEETSGKVKKGIYFQLGSWYLGLYRNAKQNQKCISEEDPIRITENFVLPVWIGKIKIMDYKTEEQIYTQEEAKQEAVQRLQIYEKKMLQNGERCDIIKRTIKSISF